MNSVRNNALLSLILLAASVSPSLASPLAADSGAKQLNALSLGLTPAELKTLSSLEMSHLQRTFESDPADKRVKRLELLIAGVGQPGTLKQRLALIERSGSGRGPGGAGSGATDSKFGNSQAVTQLELSINKKADPKVDLPVRVSNLEKKVFGNTFPNMALKQRISRLQKTLGTGSMDEIGEAMPGQMMPGPMMMRQFGSSDFPPGLIFNSPFMSPYSTQNLGGNANVNQHMNEMFNHLNEQIRQLHRGPNGLQEVPRPFVQPENSFDFSDGLPPIPDNTRPKAPVLPPYMDSNSI